MAARDFKLVFNSVLPASVMTPFANHMVDWHKWQNYTLVSEVSCIPELVSECPISGKLGYGLVSRLRVGNTRSPTGKDKRFFIRTGPNKVCCSARFK